ncbi:hypothetical protein [Spirosoma agri]|uniref:Uncharacterized protein n=1 Tax=Spirosoma agri TaxID=1987381 RepID=A0A6M0ICJ0_9BACT|nr:hypothetical protein [Spirosoma agri]NEU65924.1 hypothetical protein [Spirosoma agri]
MAERSQPLQDDDSGSEEDFYRMLEEYTQQVRQRYRIPIRLNLPRTSGKKAGKRYVETK